MNQTKKMIVVESMNKKQLLALLGIPTYKRLNTKLQPHLELIGKPNGKSFSAKQVELIISLLGTKKVIDPDKIDSLENANTTVQRRIAKFESDAA